MIESNEDRALLASLLANWQAEMESHATYQALAESEASSRRRNVMRGLAAAELYHAQLWASEINSLHGDVPISAGKVNGRADTFLPSAGGIDSTLRRLRTEERREIQRYKEQSAKFKDAASQAVLREVLADENEHHVSLSRLIRARPAIGNLAGADAKNIRRAIGGKAEKTSRSGWMGQQCDLRRS